MEIHGLRLYTQTVTTLRGVGAPIFVHGRISDDYPDFLYLFRHLADSWAGHTFVSGFGLTIGEDPLPDLRDQFGASLINAELDGQLMFLDGDDFPAWAARHPEHCQFLLIFAGVPPFDLARRIFWDVDFHLTPETWPASLRAVLHCWDDIFWQLFSVARSDIESLIRAHRDDPKLKLFFADLDREFPDPSNQELRPARLDDRR